MEIEGVHVFASVPHSPSITRPTGSAAFTMDGLCLREGKFLGKSFTTFSIFLRVKLFFFSNPGVMLKHHYQKSRPISLGKRQASISSFRCNSSGRPLSLESSAELAKCTGQ